MNVTITVCEEREGRLFHPSRDGWKDKRTTKKTGKQTDRQSQRFYCGFVRCCDVAFKKNKTSINEKKQQQLQSDHWSAPRKLQDSNQPSKLAFNTVKSVRTSLSSIFAINKNTELTDSLQNRTGAATLILSETGFLFMYLNNSAA